MDKAFIQNLLKLSLQYHLQQLLNNSYQNYHVKGLSSLILSRSAHLTLRLYVCLPGKTELNPANNNLLVHNHAFDFQTQVLTGYIENAVYEAVRSPTTAETWYQYIYASPLQNDQREMRLTFVKQTGLNLTRLQRVEAGSSYCLRHHEFHRIFVPTDRLVSMLFWQHPKVEYMPTIFSKIPQPEIFPTAELYRRFSSSAAIEQLIHQVIDSL